MVQFGETALMVASFHGWYSVVRRLVDAGANLEAKNRVKRTALMLAASEGHTNVVATLLRAGSDLDSMEPGVGLSKLSVGLRVDALFTPVSPMVAQAEVADGTVLMDACRRNHAAVVASVLKAGANTEMRDRAYKTALMVAAEHGSADCARVLLRGGAQADAKDYVRPWRVVVVWTQAQTLTAR